MLHGDLTVWPTQAHLVYASKSIAELQLFDGSIISNARHASRLSTF